MGSYLVTKTFYDLWDHFLAVLVFDLIVFGLAAVGLWAGSALGLVVVVLPLIAAAVGLLSVLFVRLLDGPRKGSLKKAATAALLYSLLSSGVLGLGVFAVGFYLTKGGLLSQTLGFLMLWLLAFWL